MINILSIVATLIVTGIMVNMIVNYLVKREKTYMQVAASRIIEVTTTCAYNTGHDEGLFDQKMLNTESQCPYGPAAAAKCRETAKDTTILNGF